MATPNQRAIAILDAMVNGTSTTNQRNRALAAFGSADGFLRELRTFILGRVQSSESSAQKLAIDQTVATDIAASFTEAP